MSDVQQADRCPWCAAEARDTFNFTCGSVRPSYVTPSPVQADKCRIGILRATIARLPHTADGEPVICDGMTIFCPKGHENKLTHATGRLYCTSGECWDDGCQGDSGSGTHYRFDECKAGGKR